MIIGLGALHHYHWTHYYSAQLNTYAFPKLRPPNTPRASACLLLLLVAGDIAKNPGPATGAMFPCGVCQLQVSWTQKAVACDNCDVWHHKTCASMNSTQFDGIENTQWQCHCCRSVNNMSFTFQSFNLSTHSNNSDLLLHNTHGDDSVFLKNSTIVSPTEEGGFTPIHASSPINREEESRGQTESTTSSNGEPTNSLLTPEERNSLRIGTVNANSIKGKRAELAELVESTKVDILIISETKLPSA